MDCIFCQIIQRKISADIIYEDDSIIVISDIFPKAPQHKLIIPKKHIPTLNELSFEDRDLIAQMMFKARDLAHELNIDKSGYRVIINCNKDAGQIVYHLHLHLMGGKKLSM
jgi:histidine triad (HIT) family protein